MSIFKDCDIRGVYGKDLHDETAYALGRALATKYPAQTWLVGGDVRVSTPALKQALLSGLLCGGAQAFDLGMLPTPAFYFARERLRLPMGVMVTASHNPAQYNGFKLALGELPVTPEDISALEDLMRHRAFAQGEGSVSQYDIMGEYRSDLLAALPKAARSCRLVVDAGNGCMSLIAPDVLRALGHDVMPLFCSFDGTFPSRDPNPAVSAHLGKLAEAVRAQRAELGIAFDGDGDRVVFVDETGNVLASEESLVLFMRELLDKPSSVVYDIKSWSIVKNEAERLGSSAVMERSGHAFIKRTFLRLGSALAGEVSGHFFFAQRRGDDGLYAAMIMANLLAKSATPLSGRLAGLPRPAITPDIRLPMTASDADAVMEAFSAWASRYEVTALDGLRALLPSGAWALLRRSVTEPAVTLRLEARDKDALRSLISELLREVPMLAGRHELL